MQITTRGYVLIPSTFLLVVLKPRTLVYLLILFLSFQVTGVLNIEKYEFSLQIYKLLIIIIAIRFIIETLTFKKMVFSDAGLYRIALVGALFTFYSLFMSLILPNIFSGVPVFVPHLGIDYSAIYGPQPLVFSFYNIVAPLYIVFYYLTLLYIITRRWTKKDLKLVENLFVMAFWINFIVSISQFMTSFLHFSLDITPFFYNILQREYSISSFIIPRLQGLFQEPSMFAPLLVGFFSWAFYQTIEFRKKIYFVFSILTLIMIFFTISTTAYISVVVMTVIIILHSKFIKFDFRKIAINLNKMTTIFLIIALTICIVIIFASLFIRWQNITKIINFAIFKKTETSSFKNRAISDIHALKLFIQTYGLGVGLGSNRPSSLITYLLSQLGFVGTLLFFIFVLKIITYTKLRLKKSHFMGYYFLVPAVIISQILSYPDITNPTLWEFIYIAIIASISQKKQDIEANKGVC